MVEGRFNQTALPDRANEPATRWRWWMIGLSICGGVSTIAAAAFWWLTVLPPLPECQQISQISPDRERLYCAQAAAESGELPQLLAGIDTLKDWTPDRPLYTEAQRSLAEWSEVVLRQAWRELEHSDLNGAIELARRIPPSSPAYDRAQSAISNWQQQWQQGDAIIAQARTALRTQQWERATERIAALNDLKLDYWGVQARALTQQMAAERQARQLLARAKQTAQANQPDQLGAAMTLLGQMNRNTLTWAEAQISLNQWGDRLLKHGAQQWQQGQLNAAIATAKIVETNPNLAADAQTLRHLSQARKLAIVSTGQWQPSPLQIAHLSEAVAAARAVKPDSRFYAQAQSSLKSWQAYLDDLQQLQFAQATASLGHRVALAAAIEQAAQVAPHRPRRVQAQTLIAHWSNEIQRQEDRPLLTKARRLAEPDTIPALQQAIAQARQISIDRVLRPEAQGLIYVWTQRIQTIEDQPILTRARAAAREGNLTEAIQIARSIPSGRALSTEARIAVRNWQNQIRARELARLRAIREREAAEQRRLERARSADLDRRPTLDRSSSEAAPSLEESTPDSIAEPSSRRSRRSQPDAPPASTGSISPPEQTAPQRDALPPLRLVPPPRPEPSAAAPAPVPPPAAEPAPPAAEPAPPPPPPAAIEKPVPALP